MFLELYGIVTVLPDLLRFSSWALLARQVMGFEAEPYPA
jgi:hypothetical protein